MHGTLLVLGVGIFFRVFHKVLVALIASSILALIAFLVISVFTLNLIYVAIGTLGAFLVCFLIVGRVWKWLWTLSEGFLAGDQCY